MIIRPATKEDKKEMLKLIHEFDEYFVKEQLFPEKILPFTQYKNKEALLENVVSNWLSNSDNFVFVAEENEELVGHIVGSIVDKNDRVLDKEGSIDEWFVTEDYRGKGVGKHLYSKLIEIFREHKCNHLGLKVYSANSSTIELYHKMGFLDLETVMVQVLD